MAAPLNKKREGIFYPLLFTFPTNPGSTKYDAFWMDECVPLLTALAKRLRDYGARVTVLDNTRSEEVIRNVKKNREEHTYPIPMEVD